MTLIKIGYPKISSVAPFFTIQPLKSGIIPKNMNKIKKMVQ